MLKILVSILVLTGALVGLVLTSRPPMASEDVEERDKSRTSAGSPILVELFTSEGCSSCPPADELLTRLEQTNAVEGVEVIALSEHVDYWNRLGWADPYSSSQFSARQNDYGSVFGADEIYTPQMVVDGRIQFVGSNAGKARDAISKAAGDPKAGITIKPLKEAGRPQDEILLDVRVADLPDRSEGGTVDVVLAMTESGLRSNVSRGENAGRKLTHTAVVRKLTSLGVVDASGSFSSVSSVKLEKEWARNNLKAIVFVQERTRRRVLGAAAAPLAGSE
ncbi:MAG TPA: DUF1223 domain-containing protein [Blastocatellia bacterium]|nr:DUF1223 domain-containing protein [Blastocatellia bacterium]